MTDQLRSGEPLVERQNELAALTQLGHEAASGNGRLANRRVPSWTASIAAAVLIAGLSACGGDDTPQESNQPGDAVSTSEPSSGDGPSSNEMDARADDSKFGKGTGTAIVDGTTYTFTSQGDELGEGRCLMEFGVVIADLVLREQDGTPLPADSGALNVQVPTPGAKSDSTPRVQLTLPSGFWAAGVDDPNAPTTPDVTLTADGFSVSGTQTMSSTSQTNDSGIEAEISLGCGQ